jgi:hypothetical protein
MVCANQRFFPAGEPIELVCNENQQAVRYCDR